MGALRQSRSFNTDMSSSTSQSGSTTLSGYPSGVYVPSVNQGLPTLIVMIVVLLIIVLFCFWGAPAVRAFCRRKICCCCPMDEPTLDNGSTADGSATPTIILLPYGRMLVVDRSVFAQLQADHTGIDFMELSANLIRAQRLQNGSNPSILESEATSKGLSPTSIDFLPPAYEDIFGTKTSDLPPSYSEISIMFRKMSGANSDNCSVASGSERNARLIIRERTVLQTSEGVGIKRNHCFLSTPTLGTLSKEGEFGPEMKGARHDFTSLENNIERNDQAHNRRKSAENIEVMGEIIYSEPNVGGSQLKAVSLENNIEGNDQGAHQQGNNRRKSAENNGVMGGISYSKPKEGSSQLKTACLENSNESDDQETHLQTHGRRNSVEDGDVVGKIGYSGPKVRSFYCPEEIRAKSSGPCDSVQYLQSRQRRASVDSKNGVEYVDRESTV